MRLSELLHAPDAVAKRVTVAVELTGRFLPLAVLLDVSLERLEQLASILALTVLDRPSTLSQ